jgi:hypothetical protein
MSLNSMVKHAFKPDEIFDSTTNGEEIYSGLGLATLGCCHTRLSALSASQRGRLSYITGHIPMGIHREFAGRARYFTVVRHPVDRVISFYYFLIQMGTPLLVDGRPLEFEEFVASHDDIHLNNYQVRVISGCAELDANPPANPGLTPGLPVERCHLDVAKRNIEELFLAAAPVDQIVDLALMLRLVYGWPMRRLQTEYKNLTKGRPKLRAIPPQLIRSIEQKNAYDLELYEWVRNRFAAQKEPFEPQLSRDRRLFQAVNSTLNSVGQILPWKLRKQIAELLFYA